MAGDTLTQPNLVELRKDVNKANNDLETADRALWEARNEYVKATEVSGQTERRNAAAKRVEAAQTIRDEAYARRLAAYRALHEVTTPEAD